MTDLNHKVIQLNADYIYRLEYEEMEKVSNSVDLNESLLLLLACIQINRWNTKWRTKNEEPKWRAKEEEPLAEGAVKTGLAVISSVEKSKDAGEKDGLAQTDSVIVAVTVDKDGKIVQTIIDTAQTKIEFSKEGKIIPDLNTVFKSKQELKEEYGMGKASSIEKEWYDKLMLWLNM